MTNTLDDDEYESICIKEANYNEEDLSEKSFYHCIFEKCSFQFANLQFSSFEKCTFRHCNVTLAQIRGARFFDTRFSGSKLLGLNWGECSGVFKANFDSCILDESSFSDMNLQRYMFRESQFKGSTFANTNLSHAKFIDCDLEDCRFHNTTLHKTDFSTARNYFINAESNKISGAIFSLPEAISLLKNFDITIT